MIYNTKDGKRVNYNLDGSLVHGGTQGRIYRINELECLKEYVSNNGVNSMFDDYNTKFNQDMFDYFKCNFDNMEMCKLYELLYDDRNREVVGYTMKYYEEMVDNILNMPVSYILDNFSLIYDLVMKLTDECIRIVDMHCDNVINTNDGMVLIDYDKYYFDRDSSKDILEYINKSALMYTFNGIFKKALKKMGIDVDIDKDMRKKISILFNMETTPLLLKYRFRGYDRAIDYIVNHR